MSIFNKRNAGKEFVLVQAAPLRFLQMMPIDQINDLQMPRQQPPEEFGRPALERFRQQRVIGIAQRCACDRPGVFPVEIMLVHQDAHQLGNRDRWMRVVELDGCLLSKVFQCRKIVEMPPDQIL